MKGIIQMSNVSMKFLISASVFALAAVAAPQQVSAQSQAESAGGPEEIVVTARKREEKLLDVPVAITAFSSAALQDENISSLQDLAAFTPGLTVDATLGGSNRDDRSFNVFVIRGMYPSSTANPTTSVFINGAPITTNQIAGLDDVERVEVLKGPQSAYFGRETFAGAINVVTKDPSKTFDGDINVLVGSRDYRDLRGMVEGTLIDDILTARATFRDYARDGSYGNQAAVGYKATPNQTLGDQSTRSGTLELVFTPIDNFKVKAFGTMWEDNDGPSAQETLDGAVQGNCYGTYFCGVVPNALVGPSANTVVDKYVQAMLNSKSGANLLAPGDAVNQFGLHRDAYHANVNMDYYVESLGFTVNSLTAVNKQIYSTLIDLDDSDTSNVPNPLAFIPGVQPYWNWPFLVEGRSFDFSEELRLTSDQDQRFRWTVGANYLWSKTSSSLSGELPFGYIGSPPGYNEQTTIGAFFGLAFDIFDNLTLSFDGRYQIDEEKPFNPNGTVAANQYYHTFIPRTSLQYKFDPDWMAYATYSEGVNPAASNIGSITQLDPAQLADASAKYGLGLLTQPEYLKNYELGVKGRFLDGKATLSADIYYDIWSNQIVTAQLIYYNSSGAPILVSPYLNIGKTTLQGIEADGTLQPIEHVFMNGGFAINDSRINHYVCYTCQQITGSSYVNGNQLPNVSKYQGTVGIKYTDDLSVLPGWSWFTRVDYIYKSGSYDLSADLAKTPATNLVNLKIGVETDGIQVEGFIDNLTNETAYTNVIPEYRLSSPAEAEVKPDAVTVGLPNLITFGLRARYKFGGPVESSSVAAASYTPPPVVAAKPATMARSYMVFFDFNKSDLTPQATAIVDTAAKNAGPSKATELVVTGHTDTVGSDAYNMRLSRRRAESVAAELEKQGIKSSEIEIVAKGKHDLLVPTGDGVREPQNRRVTIVYEGAAGS
jgi:iron complex outermembrane receptor protein